MIPWWKVDILPSEKAAVMQAMDRQCFSLGPVTEAFEREFSRCLGVKHAIAVTNGSSALLMALLALEVGPGDEVIVPNRTWVATAHAVRLAGAKVVFCDTQRHIPVLDLLDMKQKITNRTRAIIPVSLNGRSVQMAEIQKTVCNTDIHIIEDACQALMSRDEDNDYMGTKAELACFSFSMAKLLPTGQGGCVVTNDRKLADQLRLIRTQGVVDLVNCNRFNDFGFNFRITDLQSALAAAQLPRLPERIDSLKNIYTIYRNELAKIDLVNLIPVDIEAGELPLYIEVLVEGKRDVWLNRLKGLGIQTRPFYPNLNTAPYFGCKGKFQNSILFQEQGVVLPCGPDQAIQDIQNVISALSRISQELLCHA